MKNFILRFSILVSITFLGTFDVKSQHGHSNVNLWDIEDDFAYGATTHVTVGKMDEDTLDAFGFKILLANARSKVWYIHAYNSDTTWLSVAYRKSKTEPSPLKGYRWRELNADVNGKLERYDKKNYRGLFWFLWQERIAYHVLIVPFKKKCEQHTILGVSVATDNGKRSLSKFFKNTIEANAEENFAAANLFHKGVIHFPEW